MGAFATFLAQAVPPELQQQPAPATGTTKVDAAVFLVAAVICIAGALGVVLSRNPIHSALNLVMTLFGVAVLFIAQNAHFLAAVQVIVYAGAIVVLFLFVIMLLGIDKHESMEHEPLGLQRPLGIGLGVLVLAEMVLLSRATWSTGPVSSAATDTTPNVEQLGRSIFTTYLLPFEATSVLLVIAVVGAVVLARRPRRSDPEEVSS